MLLRRSRLAESEQRRSRECAWQAHLDFRNSVLPIYGSSQDTGRLPEHVGSCILLDIDGTPVLSTAAHIADELTAGATLFVAGAVRERFVPILGGYVKATIAPDGDRRSDHSDCAFWRVPDAVVADLGRDNFLDASRLSHNRASPDRRYFTALGYAVSRNAGGIDHAARSIATVPSMHTSNGVLEPALAKKLRISGDDYIFVRFEKRAQDMDGAVMDTFKPQGFSGGALLDLGDFTSLETYAGKPAGRALLSGMLISITDRTARLWR